MYQKDVDATVFILLGQSNAVGHGIPMSERDIIYEPLTNVFGLNRSKNQSFSNQVLHWSGYTSFGMNLGEEQDNTYSVANCLAAEWQNQKNMGVDLPDLYIVHIAIGNQGVAKDDMWNPDREEKLIPGVLDTVDISLHPYTVHVLSLLDDSFKKMGKRYDIMGLHWRGGENDSALSEEYLEANLENIYKRMFLDYRAALGKKMPVVLHRIVCRDRMNDLDPSGEREKSMEYINRIFEKLMQQAMLDIKIFDVTKFPQYLLDVRGNGLFIEDCVHFTPEVNQWVAREIMTEYYQKTLGLPAKVE